MAGICVVCLIAALFLGATIAARLQGAGDPASPPAAPFTPPTQAPLTWPTEAEDCENGGWRDFAQFRDEQECLDHVNGLGP